jgi:hypothetical protein
MEDFGKVYNPKGAASIVINVKTGEILAMASYPSYEPKDFLTEGFHKKNGKNIITIH